MQILKYVMIRHFFIVVEPFYRYIFTVLYADLDP